MIESKHDAHYGFTFIINGGGMRSIIGIKHDVDTGNRRTFCSSINAYIVQVLYCMCRNKNMINSTPDACV